MRPARPPGAVGLCAVMRVVRNKAPFAARSRADFSANPRNRLDLVSVITSLMERDGAHGPGGAPKLSFPFPISSHALVATAIGC